MFLKLENITTGFGKKQVLTDVSFEVEKGETVLLSGGNGSGKSTVLKTIYGLLKPWDNTNSVVTGLAPAKNQPSSARDVTTKIGRVIFEGKDITAKPVASMIKNGIVYMPQKHNVFEDFTIEENLLTSASIYPRKVAKTKLEKVYANLPILKSMRKRTPFNMSGGERQILAFGNALIHSPRLFLLDEPFAGVDASNSEILFESINDLINKNTTFVIVEHKRQMLDNIIKKEIKLELGGIRNE